MGEKEWNRLKTQELLGNGKVIQGQARGLLGLSEGHVRLLVKHGKVLSRFVHDASMPEAPRPCLLRQIV